MLDSAMECDLRQKPVKKIGPNLAAAPDAHKGVGCEQNRRRCQHGCALFNG